MRRKQKNTDNEKVFWIAYSDLSTSLMLCFVLIFLVASKKLKEQEEERMKVAPVQEQITAGVRATLSLHDAIQKELVKTKNELDNGILTEHCRNIEDIRIPSEEESGNFYLGITFKNASEIREVEDKQWFKSGSYELEENAEECISKIAPKLISKLYRVAEIRDSIKQILIEGHADLTACNWSEISNRCVKRREPYSELTPSKYFIDNLKLSQMRASRVAEFILDRKHVFTRAHFPLVGKKWTNFERWLEGHLTATGRSHSKPICKKGIDPGECYNRPNLADETKSRRIEFRVLLNSDYSKMRSLIKEQDNK